MQNEKMREEFEARNSHRAWFVSGGRKDSGPEGYVYDDFTTDMCWTCWVDSRETLVIELPEKCEYADSQSDYAKGHRQGRRDVVDCIEAAGLKVKP